MAVVKLRKGDEKILDGLESTIRAVKGRTNKAEAVGLGLRFAYSKLDEFVVTILKDVESEPLLDLVRNPSDGEKTDARRVEEYLYG